jgi:flagellar biosynthesis chaperone FliJ
LIIEKQESYLSDIINQLNTLLNNRKEIIEDSSGSEEVIAANALITQYNNAINALEKEINNPNYQ